MSLKIPLDIGSWTVAYYKIHNAGYSNVKGGVYSFPNTCEYQAFLQTSFTPTPVLRGGRYYRLLKVNSDAKLGH